MGDAHGEFVPHGGTARGLAWAIPSVSLPKGVTAGRARFKAERWVVSQGDISAALTRAIRSVPVPMLISIPVSAGRTLVEAGRQFVSQMGTVTGLNRGIWSLTAGWALVETHGWLVSHGRNSAAIFAITRSAVLATDIAGGGYRSFTAIEPLSL